MSKSRRRKTTVSAVKQSDVDFEIAFYQSILESSPDFVQALIALGNLYTKKGWYERGLIVDKRLVALRPDNPYIYYNLACSYSLTDDVLSGVEALKKALELGFNDFNYMEKDEDLSHVYHHPEFQDFFIPWKEKKSFPRVSLRRVV